MKSIATILFLSMLFVGRTYAQSADPVPPPEDTVKPYLKYPALPAFNVRELDSSTIFNTYNIPKGKPVALILFDPDCKHCKNMIKHLTAGMDSLKDIQFYLVTLSRNFAPIRKFYEDNHLADYKNIALVGQDYEFFFITFYKTRSYPVVALYDDRKKFMDMKEGEFNVHDLYIMLHGS